MHNHQPALPPDLCGGVWWCLTCNAAADLEDPGSAYPLCVRCLTRKCEWRRQNLDVLRTPKPPRIAPPPPEAAPALNVKRLPRAERPSLVAMFSNGYLFCHKCDQVTKYNAENCCVLCGSSRVEFIPPVMPEPTEPNQP